MIAKGITPDEELYDLCKGNKADISSLTGALLLGYSWSQCNFSWNRNNSTENEQPPPLVRQCGILSNKWGVFQYAKGDTE